MSTAASLAVEITRREDSLDIWVDANNNGQRDDDDVNIFVTAGGGFYTVSPTFKQALDATIQGRIKDLSIQLLKQQTTLANAEVEDNLRELALELVLKATATPEA